MIFLPGYHKHSMWIWHQTQSTHCKYVNLLLEYCYITVTVKARFLEAMVWNWPSKFRSIYFYSCFQNLKISNPYLKFKWIWISVSRQIFFFNQVKFLFTNHLTPNPQTQRFKESITLFSSPILTLNLTPVNVMSTCYQN